MEYIISTAINHSQYIGFFIAFIIAIITVPIVRKVCINKGLYDIPDDRKIHKTPIPRLGGVAIWFSACLTMGILILWFWNYPHGNALSGIFIGGTMIFIVGVIDDLKNLSPKTKLIFQILSASVAYMLGVQILSIHIPFVQGAISL